MPEGLISKPKGTGLWDAGLTWRLKLRIKCVSGLCGFVGLELRGLRLADLIAIGLAGLFVWAYSYMSLGFRASGFRV